jgi:hypothetical protein
MTHRLRVRHVMAPFLLATFLVFVPKLALRTSPLYTVWLTDRVLTVIASTCKLLALGSGSVFAALCARRLEQTNPVRLAWWLMSVWLGTFFLGQAVLSTYEIVLRSTPPLPSVGDALFLVGYLSMIAGAVRFVRVYRNSGFPVGHKYEHAAIAAAGTVLFAVMGWALLAPIACSTQPLGERFINVAYPVLDFIVLVPMLVLLRITSHFRGGRVWSVWATLLAGFAVASGADIVFAYVSSIHERSLQPLQDPMFVGSYFLLACGAALQLELLSD